MKQYHKIK